MVVSSAVLGEVMRIPRKVRSDEALFPTVPALSCRYGSLLACGSHANKEAGGKPDAGGSRR